MAIYTQQNGREHGKDASFTSQPCRGEHMRKLQSCACMNSKRPPSRKKAITRFPHAKTQGTHSPTENPAQAHSTHTCAHNSPHSQYLDSSSLSRSSASPLGSCARGVVRTMMNRFLAPPLVLALRP